MYIVSRKKKYMRLTGWWIVFVMQCFNHQCECTLWKKEGNLLVSKFFPILFRKYILIRWMSIHNFTCIPVDTRQRRSKIYPTFARWTQHLEHDILNVVDFFFFCKKKEINNIQWQVYRTIFSARSEERKCTVQHMCVCVLYTTRGYSRLLAENIYGRRAHVLW